MALKPHQKFGLALTIIALASISALTLASAPDQVQTAADTSVWCLLCGDLGVVDVTLNILLFIPLGIGLSLLGLSRWRALMIVALASITVETLQLSFIAGRDASLSDLLTNTIGGMLGYWLGPNLPRLVIPVPRSAFRLAIGTLILWMMQQAFAAWALQPSLPRSVYYGQWAPELGQFDHFSGKVFQVTVNGVQLGNGRFDASDVVRAELANPSMELNVQAESGEITERTAPIFSIFDDQQRGILLVGAKDRDLVIHLRTRLDRLRLRSPSIVLPGAIPPAAGVRMAIKAEYGRARYRVQVLDQDQVFSREVPMSASWGWSFVLPFSYEFGPAARWLTISWLAGFWLMIGFWAAQSRRAGVLTWWGLLVLTLLIGLAGIPSFFGLEIAAIGEWIAAMAGAALGWTLGIWGSSVSRLSARRTAHRRATEVR